MAVDVERINKLGDLGEALFKTLCVKACLAATKTGKDEFGWDYIVELPINRLSLLDFDSQPPAQKILCQVKATDNFDRHRVSMKVSNWERLAATPMPAFVLIADFQHEDDASSLFLCHFNQPRIIQTLKKIRELNAGGVGDLAKHEMLFVAFDEEKVEQTGAALKNAILAATGISMSEYSRNKSLLLETVGYEKGRYLLQCETAMSIEEVADALVGIGSIEVEKGSISTLRFGQAIEKEIFQKGSLTVEPIAEVNSCKVTVESVARAARASFDASVTMSRLPHIDPALFRVRVSSGALINILIREDRTQIKFDIKPEMCYKLSEICDVIEFILLCQKRAKIEFAQGGRSFCSLEIGQELDFDPALSEYLRRAKSVRRFLDFIGHRDDVILRLNDLFEPAEASEWIDITSRAKSRISTGVDSGHLRWKGKGLFANVIHLRANDQNIISFVYFNADFRLRNKIIKGILHDAKCHSYMIVNSEDTPALLKSFDIFSAFCRNISGGTLLMRQIAQAEELKQALTTPEA